jgi:hypothetical protein
MSDPSHDLRLPELRSTISWLKTQLSPGAPIIPLASVRARDRAEAAHGVVASFGLVSSILYDDQFGDYTVMDKPHLYLFDGVLGSHHIQTLLPLFEQMARDRQPLVMAARDADEDVLAMVALNKRRGAMRGAILVPEAAHAGAPMRDLQRATGGGLGTANEAGLRMDQPAHPPRLLATLHEVIIVAPRPSLATPATLGLLFVGGEDLAIARARTRAARELMAMRALN